MNKYGHKTLRTGKRFPLRKAIHNIRLLYKINYYEISYLEGVCSTYCLGACHRQEVFHLVAVNISCCYSSSVINLDRLVLVTFDICNIFYFRGALPERSFHNVWRNVYYLVSALSPITVFNTL